MIALMDAVASALVVLLACAAAGQDALTRTIDDRFSLAILGLFGLTAAAGLMAGAIPLAALIWPVAAAALVFCIGLGLFVVGAFGGGDVKMLSALAVWISPHQGLAFLAIMALSGGVIAIGMLLLIWLNRKSAGKQGFMNDFFTSLGNDRNTVPYGVAIAIGAGFTWVTGGLGLPGVSAAPG